MSKVEFARDKLRMQLSKLIDEYGAMVILLAQMNVSAKGWLDEERRTLATASKRQLQFGIEKLTTQIKTLRAETGATRPLGSYRKFLDVQVAVVPQGDFIFTLPAYLLVFLFNKYPGVAKPLEDDELPLHSSIEMDYCGRYEHQPNPLRYLENMRVQVNYSLELAAHRQPNALFDETVFD
jgi:hypothetical protein